MAALPGRRWTSGGAKAAFVPSAAPDLIFADGVEGLLVSDDGGATTALVAPGVQFTSYVDAPDGVFVGTENQGVIFIPLSMHIFSILDTEDINTAP